MGTPNPGEVDPDHPLTAGGTDVPPPVPLEAHGVLGDEHGPASARALAKAGSVLGEGRRAHPAPRSPPHDATRCGSAPLPTGARPHRSPHAADTARRRRGRSRGRDAGSGRRRLRRGSGASQCASSWRTVRRWSTGSVPARTAMIPTSRRVRPLDDSVVRCRQLSRGAVIPASAHTSAVSSDAHDGAFTTIRSACARRSRPAPHEVPETWLVADRVEIRIGFGVLAELLREFDRPLQVDQRPRLACP